MTEEFFLEPTITVADLRELLKDPPEGFTFFKATNGLFVGINRGVTDAGDGLNVEIMARVISADGEPVFD